MKAIAYTVTANMDPMIIIIKSFKLFYKTTKHNIDYLIWGQKVEYSLIMLAIQELRK